MMDWNAVAIMFICVAMNHMGFISAIEREVGHELPILNCTKCSSFWLTLVYSLYTTKVFIASVAMAFLLSYVAVWLELLMGLIDSFYLKFYEKIVPAAGADTLTADPDKGNADDAVSELPPGGQYRQGEKETMS